MTAEEIVTEARDHHGSFDPSSQPNRVVLRALSRLVRRIVNRVTDQSEDALAVDEEVSEADLQAAVTAGTGITMPDHILILGSIYTWKADSDAEIRVELVDYTNVYDRALRYFPAVAMYGSKLFPVDLQKVYGLRSQVTGWEDYLGLRYKHVPVPAQLEALSATVPLPESARDALVLNLAVFMAGRSPGVLAELPLLPKQAKDEEDQAVSTLCNLDSTTRWTIGRSYDR